MFFSTTQPSRKSLKKIKFPTFFSGPTGKLSRPTTTPGFRAVTRIGDGDRWVSDAIAYLAALGYVIKTSVFALITRGDGARRFVLHTVCGVWPSPRKGLSTHFLSLS